MRPSKLGPHRYLALSGLLLLLAVVAHGDARESYKEGVAAIEGSRWGDAARFFRAAIEEKTEERNHLLPARRYFPHYYLGVALAEENRCRQAIPSLEESERQGKVQKQADLFSDLRSRIGECRAFLERLDAARGEVDEQLEDGERVAGSLETLSERPVLAALWSSDTKSFASRQRQALAALEAAKTQASAGYEAADLNELERAKGAAAEATRSLEELISDAREELGDRNAATATALEGLENQEKEARNALRGISDLAPYPPQLGQKVAALERQLEEIDQQKEEARAGQLADFEKGLAEALEDVARAARRPPRNLQETVTTFLEGKYQDTLDRLADSDQRYEKYLCAIRAASQYALWVLESGEEGEVPPELIEGVVTCSEREPAMPARYFSPRFRDFFAATVAAHLEEEATQAEEGVAGLEDPNVEIEEVDLTGGES